MPQTVGAPRRQPTAAMVAQPEDAGNPTRPTRFSAVRRRLLRNVVQRGLLQLHCAEHRAACVKGANDALDSLAAARESMTSPASLAACRTRCSGRTPDARDRTRRPGAGSTSARTGRPRSSPARRGLYQPPRRHRCPVGDRAARARRPAPQRGFHRVLLRGGGRPVIKIVDAALASSGSLATGSVAAIVLRCPRGGQLRAPMGRRGDRCRVPARRRRARRAGHGRRGRAVRPSRRGGDRSLGRDARGARRLGHRVGRRRGPGAHHRLPHRSGRRRRPLGRGDRGICG